MTNSLGQTIWQQQIARVSEVDQWQINCSDATVFPAGLYFVTVHYERKVATTQLILQR